MELTITWTGICAIAKDAGGATIFLPNGTKGERNCEDSADIPPHIAYVKYLLSDATFPRTNANNQGGEAYVVLDEVELSLSATPDPPLTYPGSRKVIPGVVEMSRVYPGYRMREELNDLSKVPGSLVSACMRLEGGEFRLPNPRGLMWHFFPPRGQLVRQSLAQAVAVQLSLPVDEVTIYTKKLETQTAPQKLLTLKGDGIGIVIGNTPQHDIFPTDINALPPVGPDYHFELYYKLMDRYGDSDCLPISYFEGIPALASKAHCGGGMTPAPPFTPPVKSAEVVSLREGGFVSLGGGNCPPTQWP